MYTADKQDKFIELRAQGWSFSHIASELYVSKRTLIEWSHEFDPDIKSLRTAGVQLLQEKVTASREEQLDRLLRFQKDVEDELAEAGRGLSPQSLVQWLKTGYEDYLKNRQNIDEVKTQAEFAADLLRELCGIDVSVVHQACLVLTAIQTFTAIDEYGGEALRKALLNNPASYFTMLNSLCKTIGPTIALEKHRMACESKIPSP